MGAEEIIKLMQCGVLGISVGIVIRFFYKSEIIIRYPRNKE